MMTTQIWSAEDSSEPSNGLSPSSPSTPLEGVTISDYNEFQQTLNPVVIEQSGNDTTTTIHAETDSGVNTQVNLTIDTANDWLGSKASVSLWNLQRQYVENGSLSDGIEGVNTNPSGSVSFYPYGWDAISGSPDAGMQLLAAYTNEEIETDVIGDGVGGNYFYANGSYVYWIQTVNNTPQLEEFILYLDYFYEKGPTGVSNVTLRAYADDTVIWNITAETLLDGFWYNTGNVPVNLTGIGSQFEFRIGLYLDGDFNYDKRSIGFNIDNVHLWGGSVPTFDDAGISLSIGEESALINGAETGTASITNSSFWRSENVLLEFSAPLSYSFDYVATMRSSRFTNSTSSLDLFDEGVYCTSVLGDSPQIEFHTFLGTIPDIDDFELRISLPSDWENATVYNPYGTQVTSSCTVVPGQIIIPTEILYVLGWWEVRVESPNYARSLQTFKLNEDGLTWVLDSVFRSGNATKISVEIGGSAPFEDVLMGVNITFLQPDGSQWYSELTSGGVNGEINGSQLWFGSLNATVGVWQVIASWTNGTEVAFGGTSFSLHHGALLYAHESIIETYGGLSISNFVYYQDADTNEFLTGGTISITANWSSTTVSFVADPIQNRWVGTFDTSLVGPGSHTVLVNASSAFLDDVSCTFVVEISNAGNKLTILNPTTEVGMGDTYLANFIFSDSAGIGIEGANISVDFDGFAGGITWHDATDHGEGNYSIEFTAVHADSYAITLTASKDYYEEAEGSLFILVGQATTDFSLENGTSAVISIGEQYRLVVRYTNGSGIGLEGADVSVVSTTPESGINYSLVADEGEGYYSIVLSPIDAESFTLLLRASLPDHSTQFVSFTLTATRIATQLRVADGTSSASIGVNEPFEILVFYERTSGTLTNITDATITVSFISFETLEPVIIPLGEGYLIQFPTDQIGTYEFSIIATRTGYQDDVVPFRLFVRERAMTLSMQTPVWQQYGDMNISLELLEAGTEDHVTGANVSYRLYRYLNVEMEGFLTEISPGVYNVMLRPDWYDGTGYSIRISAEKENFQLDEMYYEFQVIQVPDTGREVLQLVYTVVTYGGSSLAVLVVLVVAYRFNKARQKKKTLAALQIKKRFDDAANVLGVIVLHKKSGLPFYSKTLRGGFDEAMVSAFITAITHFRGEFGMDEKHWEFNVIPISDIVSAVPTKSLIVAFITVRPPSQYQEISMEAFGRATGAMFDEMMADALSSSIPIERKEMFENLFFDLMDGFLLETFRVDEEADFPKSMSCLEGTAKQLENDEGFKLLDLVNGMATCGIEESFAYRMVLEAVEKKLLRLTNSRDIGGVVRPLIDHEKVDDEETD